MKIIFIVVATAGRNFISILLDYDATILLNRVCLCVWVTRLWRHFIQIRKQIRSLRTRAKIKNKIKKNFSSISLTILAESATPALPVKILCQFLLRAIELDSTQHSTILPDAPVSIGILCVCARLNLQKWGQYIFLVYQQSSVHFSYSSYHQQIHSVPNETLSSVVPNLLFMIISMKLSTLQMIPII